MKNVKIVVLNKDHWSFIDTTVNKEYDAIILEPGEVVPERFAGYPGQTNDEDQAVLFLDDTDCDCACDVAGTIGVNFKIVG